MRKVVIAFCLVLFVCSPIFSQTVAGRHQIVLDDPAGDVREENGKPGKDVVKLWITSDGKNLQIKAELKEDVSFYLKNQLAGPVIEMHLNTDNNDATGGIAFWGKDRKGFEYLLEPVACIRYENGGLACLGALGDKIAGYCSAYKIYKYKQDEKMPENINNVLESTQGDITGKQLEITLPYSSIGIKSGSRIRMSIRESDGPFNDASYFPQVFFIVK
ncbi:hypothetical protein JW948_04500 [bacterium]|nr:hypothetical protein [bacterium]